MSAFRSRLSYIKSGHIRNLTGIFFRSNFGKCNFQSNIGIFFRSNFGKCNFRLPFLFFKFTNVSAIERYLFRNNRLSFHDLPAYLCLRLGEK